MKTFPKELRAKGKEGESAFKKWLDGNNLCHVFLAQDKKSFAALFADAVKRPDFLVLIESVGLIAVDVKNKALNQHGEHTLSLGQELLRVLTFERLFRIPVWYAYLGNDESGAVWHWISALKALEAGHRCGEGDAMFVTLKLENFAALRTGADLGLLYAQRHTSLTPAIPAA